MCLLRFYLGFWERLYIYIFVYEIYRKYIKVGGVGLGIWGGGEIFRM